MFGSEILEVAIGIIFVFILVSIICTAIREGIETWMKERAAYLEHAIRELLHDPKGDGLAKDLYTHPLISGLFSGDYEPRDSLKLGRPFASGGKLPSYIPTGTFVTALMDIAARGTKPGAASDTNAPLISLDSMRANVSNIGNPQVQRALLAAIDSAQGDLNKAQAKLEAWYNGAMDRVSGRYKRSTQWTLFWIGLFVAVGLNINTIKIGEYLYSHNAVRAAIVEKAVAEAKNPNFLKTGYSGTRTEIEHLGLPMGWSNYSFVGIRTPHPWDDMVSPLLGWLLTALAATLGAPFWFDVLNKVMVIRSTVKPHEKSPEEASEDRQLKTQRPIEIVVKGQEAGGADTAGST
jgi:hypothetical protein